MPRIYIGGPRGCGKTTVVKIISEKVPEIVPYYGSGVMQQLSRARFGKTLDNLNETEKNLLREDMFGGAHILPENMIAEGHFWLNIKEANNFDALVLIKISKDLLIKFRNEDAIKFRSLAEEDIDEEKKELNDRIELLRDSGVKNIIEVINCSSLDDLTRKIYLVYSGLKKNRIACRSAVDKI